MNMHSTAPAAAYDPLYDPLVSDGPGQNRDYAPTYWIATAGTPPQSDGPILADRDADVAIVGSGFTGLSCAIFLAREFGIKATVLEANRVAWGCSTRNGGQAQNATGRLSRSQ
jgi:taurine dehydrogenase large subunit